MGGVGNAASAVARLENCQIKAKKPISHNNVSKAGYADNDSLVYLLEKRLFLPHANCLPLASHMRQNRQIWGKLETALISSIIRS